MTGDPLVETSRHGRVLVVSMQRQAKRNAIDRSLADALDDALNMLDDDDGLWAGVLTGTATVFCAGSDLSSNGDYVTERGGEYGVIRRQPEGWAATTTATGMLAGTDDLTEGLRAFFEKRPPEWKGR